MAVVRVYARGIRMEILWGLIVIEFLVLGLASFRVTKFLLSDVLFSPVRDWVWRRFPPESTKIGYFFTCPWCLGFWVSLGVYFWYTMLPLQMLWLCYVLALSAFVGLITALEDRF